MALSGKICLVTGASRGIGKGIAVQLGEAGATVYVTGRSTSADAAIVGGSLKETESEINSRGGKGIAVVCDHSKDDEVKAVFEKIKQDQGKLDILVNNAYAAVTGIFREAESRRKFWECEEKPGQWWDLVNGVGLRNHYICSTYASQMMVEAKQGVIFNVSSFGGQLYALNVAYGVGKAALDRMSSDMAVELKKHGVACLTVYPGPVRTEHIDKMLKKDTTALGKVFDKAETPEFTGKAIVALATDHNVMARTGKICVSADMAREYGFKDIDGSQPQSALQLNVNLARTGHTWLAALVPNFVKVPAFIIAMQSSKF